MLLIAGAALIAVAVLVILATLPALLAAFLLDPGRFDRLGPQGSELGSALQAAAPYQRVIGPVKLALNLPLVIAGWAVLGRRRWAGGAALAAALAGVLLTILNAAETLLVTTAYREAGVPAAFVTDPVIDVALGALLGLVAVAAAAAVHRNRSHFRAA